MSILTLWVIYRPPPCFVVRRQFIKALPVDVVPGTLPTDDPRIVFDKLAYHAPTLEAARRVLPPHLTLAPMFDEEDPSIEEVYW